MKIKNDKYYTPIPLANYCWDVSMNVIGENNVVEIIEPSCGDGAFYHHEKYSPDYGFDICPEIVHRCVYQKDFLAIQIPYLKGRLIIGNPPYGDRLYLAQKFYNRSVEISDYISFILPISQMNNKNTMYKFDLLHSEDLGVHKYSGRDLHCCLNVYGRPKNGILNIKPKFFLKAISFCRQDSSNYRSFDYDVRICYWGNGTCGKILEDGDELSGVYAIRINDFEHKREILDFIKTYDWRSYVKSISAKKLYQFQII